MSTSSAQPARGYNYNAEMRSASNLNDSPATIDVRYILHTLYRRKFLILLIILTITSFSLFIGQRITPIYTAEADILIERQSVQFIDVQSVITGKSFDAAGIMSEVEIIRSRQLLGQVVDELDLVNNLLFNPYLKNLTYAVLPISTDHPQYDVMYEQSIESLRNSLSVSPVSRSRVVNVQFKSADPEVAQKVANTVAELYIENQLTGKLEDSGKASDWLETRLEELQAALYESEREVEAHKRTLIEDQGQSQELTSQQLVELNRDLIQAQAVHSDAKTRLQEVYKTLENDSVVAVASSISELLKSGLLKRMLIDESKIKRRVEELAVRYGPKHPNMVNVKAELEQIQEEIISEVANVVQTLEAEVRLAQVKENTLWRKIQGLEDLTINGSLADIHLRELQRESATNRTLYESFLQKYKSVIDQEKLQTADAKIISRAELPSSPTFPNKKLIAGLALFTSSIIAILFSFLLNMLDNRYKSIRQVIEDTNLPVLGIIPKLPRSKTKDVDYVIKRPFSSVSEAVRMIRTSITLLSQGSSNNKDVKVINVVSSVQGEGKTTVSVWMARMAALSGLRVILVDSDIRNPTLHKIFPSKNGYTLHEILSGSARLAGQDTGIGSDQKAIAVDQESGLHMVYAHKSETTTLDLINSNRMKSFIEILKKSYDLVILDAPPSLGISDGRELARLADSTVYVIRTDEMSREGVQAGIRNFRDFGLQISGVILTHVKTNSRAKYEYFVTKYANS